MILDMFCEEDTKIVVSYLPVWEFFFSMHVLSNPEHHVSRKKWVQSKEQFFPELVKEIRTMIKELAQKEKKGVLLTTHYISEAEELCDYIYVLDKGQMIAQGTKEELKDLFASEPKMVLQESGLEEILMKIIYRSRGEDSEESIFGNKSRN